MKLITYIFIFFSVFLLSHSSVLHAETIKIEGYIEEVTCAQNAPNKDCSSISALVSNIQQLSEIKIQEEILKNKNNDIAQLQIKNVSDPSHKVLLINYY